MVGLTRDWAMAGLQSGALSSSAFTGAALQHVTAVSRQQTRLIPSADIKAGHGLKPDPPALPPIGSNDHSSGDSLCNSQRY